MNDPALDVVRPVGQSSIVASAYGGQCQGRGTELSNPEAK
jgi:hypothetical protein